MIDNKLYEYMSELLRQTPMEFVRYKYGEIEWNDRMVGIVGPRGVGKSTMIFSASNNMKQSIACMSLPTTCISHNTH